MEATGTIQAKSEALSPRDLWWDLWCERAVQSWGRRRWPSQLKEKGVRVQDGDAVEAGAPLLGQSGLERPGRDTRSP